MASTAANRPLSWGLAGLVLRRATANFVEDRCTQLSAAISYFALFSLFPLALLMVSVFGIVIRDLERQQQVVDWLVNALPIAAPNVAESLRNVATLGPTLTIVSLLGTLWSASALLTAVRGAVNIAFDIDSRRPLLRGKLVDYMVIPVLGLILLSSLVLSAIWRVLRTATDFGPLEEGTGWLWELGGLAIPLSLTFIAFLFLYRTMPPRHVPLGDIWPGALVAAVGFQLTTQGFSFYVANFANYDVIYGSLGGVVALLFWVYVSANVVLFGAEVAAEVPHVRRGEARHGHEGSSEGNWRHSAWLLLRGLVMNPPPAHEVEEATSGDERSPRVRRRPRPTPAERPAAEEHPAAAERTVEERPAQQRPADTAADAPAEAGAPAERETRSEV